MIEAVVFDLGGTLIEYAGEWTAWPDLETPGFAAAYGYLQAQGTVLPSFDTFREAGFGLLPLRWRGATRGERNLRLAELLGEVTAACGVAVPLAQLFQASKQYEQAISGQAHLMPHARETLALLKWQGYKLGLLSNTMFTGEGHIADLRRYGLLEFFDALLFSADVDKWKPNPEPFWHVLADLGVEAAETAVYVGDDPASDVVGGRSAGMLTVFCVGNGRFPQPDHVIPHAKIDDLAVLPSLLERLNNSK
ncbi:MAG: HAD family hydrolase [Ardenticatenaceae bacterium]|nr:HAD family hydrolase [Ardenticatenaceae bacterium]